MIYWIIGALFLVYGAILNKNERCNPALSMWLAVLGAPVFALTIVLKVMERST